MVGLDDLDDQLDDGLGGVEYAALLAFLQRKVAEEVLVDLAEGVPRQIHRADELEQLLQHPVLQARVVARQGTLEVGVLVLDGLHGIVDSLADVVALGERQQVREAGGLGEEDHPLGQVVIFAHLAAATGTHRPELLLGG